MALTDVYCTPSGAGAHDGTSEADAYSWTEWKSNYASDYTSSTNGTHNWFKGTGFTESSDVTIDFTEDNTKHFIMEGYGTTTGDNTRAEFTMTSARIYLSFNVDGVCQIRNFKLTGTRNSSQLLYMAGDNSVMVNCWGENTATTSGGGALLMAKGTMVDCYGKSATTSTTAADWVGAITVNGGAAIRCVGEATGGGHAVYINAVNQGTAMIHCVGIGDNTTSSQAAFYVSRLDQIDSFVMAHCTGVEAAYGVYSSNSPDINAPAGFDSCLFYDISAYGFYDATGTPNDAGWFVSNCAMGSVTSGRSNLSEWHEFNPITLSADPFTDLSGYDLSLNDTVGGGALAKGVLPFGGWKQTDMAGTEYQNVGALGNNPSGGGGTASAPTWW